MPPTLRRLEREHLTGGETLAAWDAYCSRHPAATPYHLGAWGRAVVNALAHEPHYLYAEEAGRMVGVLPLFLRKSRLFGTNLVSVPAANVGGPLADDDTTRRLLVDGAIALATEHNVDFLELRGVAAEDPIASGLVLDLGRYVTVTIDLADGEANAWSRLSKGTRRRVRRAQDAGMAVELRGGVDAFYAVYAATVKRLGSPPFSKRFFDELQTGFGDSLQVGVARLASREVAVDLMISFCGVRYSVFAGSLADAWHVYPNQLLLWTEICDACEKRLRRFDLGRSLAGSTALEFKGTWGGREEPLTYGYHLHRARRVPVRTPDAPLYRMLGSLWSYLPDRIATAVGPGLVKHLF
jgi:FemAB-related protein (PEP-CTERM system-associated)